MSMATDSHLSKRARCNYLLSCMKCHFQHRASVIRAKHGADVIDECDRDLEELLTLLVSLATEAAP